MQYGVRLVVAYDGTDFSGWQAQAGQRCVQSSLAEAVARVAQHPVEVKGASRTDAGVHAAGQVASFDTDRALDPRRWAFAINRYLPPDIAVRAAEGIAPGYEPRFDARDKTYRYLLHLGPLRDPLWRRHAWHLGKQLRHRFPQRDNLAGGQHLLDVPRMQAAAQRLVGRHDFQAFRQAADTRTDTVRTMLRVDVRQGYGENPDLMALEVRGNAFMKNMVRIIAGTLFEVGRGRMSPDDVSALLQPGARRHDGGATAPPEGLTLVQINTGRMAEQAAGADPGPPIPSTQK